MKRDMDVVRALLLRLEQMAIGAYSTHNDFSEIENAHLELLLEAGLIRGALHHSEAGTLFLRITGITWSGYELLDSIRDERTWKEAMQRVGSTVGSASLEVLSKIISEIAYKLITT